MSYYRSKDSVYEPSAKVIITGASGEWLDSISNKGSVYQEIHCRAEGIDLTGRSFVDTAMKNYHSREWDQWIQCLNQNCQLQGQAVIRQKRETGELYVDADHFIPESVIFPDGTVERVKQK